MFIIPMSIRDRLAGPTNETVTDMWRMIWQLKSSRIAMVTQLSENGVVYTFLLSSTIKFLLCIMKIVSII